VREDNTVACWGLDDYGQATPLDLDPDVYTFHQVSTGYGHTCAIVECDPPPGQFCLAGNVRCWGWDDLDQATPGTVYLDQIDAGDFHTCGLKADNTIFCFGSDTYGESTVPAIAAGWQYTQVSAGGYHTCAIQECTGICVLDTTVKCWGQNNQGQATVPPGTDQFVQVSAGLYHTCAVRDDGFVACWGRDSEQQSTPPRTAFQYVSAGGFFTCGLRTDDSVACWGNNNHGQATPPEGSFKAISAGTYHACGLRPDGSVVCWGSDDFNQNLPPAGLCGLFDADFEVGGDCRWSNSGTPCWTADCDGDGYVSDESQTVCSATVPIGAPPECPGGSWVAQTATCGAFDCLDDNITVHSGQGNYFNTGFGTAGGPADLYDYNCNGVEEKGYRIFSTNICCSWNGSMCIAPSGPGCDFQGWDSATVTEVPECGQTANYRACVETSPGVCVEQVISRAQACR
jgi:hypothetical protein